MQLCLAWQLLTPAREMQLVQVELVELLVAAHEMQLVQVELVELLVAAREI